MVVPVRSKFAALLVAAALALPGTAFAASDMVMPISAPLPVDMPDKGPVKDAPRLAEVKVSREQAIDLVAKTFPMPAGLNEPNASLSQYQQQAVWRIEWSTPSKQPDRRFISAEVDAVTGKVLRYSSSSASTEAMDLSYSRDEAFKLASQWLDKLAPDLKSTLRLMDDPLQYGFYGGNMAFNFHWDRMEQGYPAAGQGVDIAIDARSGELTGFSQTWQSDLTYTLPETILGKEKAEALYREELPMQLQYQYFRLPGTEKGEWRLVYRPFAGFPFISQDGKLVGWDGKPLDMARLTNTKLVPASATPWVKPEKAVDAEAALAAAKAIAGRTDEPSGLNCHEYGEETKSRACYISWDSMDGKVSSVSVQIDLTTGLPVHYSNWRYEPVAEKRQPTVTEQQARDIALKFIQKHRPDLAGNALMSPAMDQRHPMESVTSYSVGFQHLKNQVAVANWTSSVEVDAFTGEIRYFWSNSSNEGQNETFPAVEGLTKQSVAMDAYLNHKGLELTWNTFHPAMYGIKMATETEAAAAKPQTMLVWAPKRVMPVEFIDARTSQLYDWQGRDLVEAAKRPTDIQGHDAQREIELLWARGIFDLKDGKFNPEQSATAEDLARWLVLAKGMQPFYAYDYSMGLGAGRAVTAENMAKSAAAPYLGAALQSGIFLPEDFGADYDPATPVSRETFALWAVRALGYGEIAKMENRIAMPFADQGQIGAKFQNAVALLHGLKIVRGDAAATFAPQREITRAEAAKILFSVASKGTSLPYYK